MTSAWMPGDVARATALADAPGLPRVDPVAAAARRRLLALDGAAGCRPLAAHSVEWRSDPPDGCTLRLQLRAGGLGYALWLADPPAHRGFGAALDAAVPAELRTACVAAAAGPALDAWAALLQVPLHLERADPIGLDTQAGPCIGFVVRDAAATMPLTGALQALDPAGWAWLAQLAERLMPRRAAPPLRVPCRAVLGSSRLTLADVRGLQAHDVLVVTQHAGSAERLECVITAGENRRVVGRARIEGRALRVLHREGDKEMAMVEIEMPAAGGAGPAGVEVSVRVELAPWRASLAELAELNAGACIDTGQDLREAAVTLWIERRCIGSGRLVALGDRLGVRIDACTLGAAAEAQDAAPAGEALA